MVLILESIKKEERLLFDSIYFLFRYSIRCLFGVYLEYWEIIALQLSAMFENSTMGVKKRDHIISYDQFLVNLSL